MFRAFSDAEILSTLRGAAEPWTRSFRPDPLPLLGSLSYGAFNDKFLEYFQEFSAIYDDFVCKDQGMAMCLTDPP